MNILLLADGLHAGGAETHIETLARGLRTRGHGVALFSEGGTIADRMKNNGFPTYSIPHVGRDPIRFLAAKRRLADIARNDLIDVLHAHTRMTALLSRGICSACGRKRQKMTRVVTVHARFRVNPFFRAVCDWGDRTIAVSEDLRAYVADAYRIPVECVDVIPNGVDTARFFPAGNPHPRKAIHILFVSRLDPDCARGALLLCEAAEKTHGFSDLFRGNTIPPSVRVTVAGGGSCFAEVARVAARVNLALGRAAVSVVNPNVPHFHLPALYRSADVFVGVSRAAMEAAASGCAVILCGNEGYGGLLSTARPALAAGNFCCRGEPSASLARLCSDLSSLLSDDARLAALSADSCAWIRRDFSANGMCRLTERSYLAALGGSGIKRR